MRFRLMTWNIHKGIGGIDRRYDIGRVIRVIADAHPDIVNLQEVDDDVPRSKYHRQSDVLGDALGYDHRFYQPNVRMRTGRYGNAILSRFPLADTHSLDLTIPFKKRRGAQIAACRIGHGAHALHIVNLHLGLVEPEQNFQLKRILTSKYFANVPAAENFVIAGDLNDMFGRLGRKILAPAGFRRAGDGSRTFPAFFPLRPLDQIFFRGTLHLRHCHVVHSALAREASDHLPLVADFEGAAI